MCSVFNIVMLDVSSVQHRNVRCALHYVFLLPHLTSGTFLVSLSLNKQPSVINFTPSFQKIWEQTLNTTSQSLQYTLVCHYHSQQISLSKHLCNGLFNFIKSRDTQRTYLSLHSLYMLAKTTWNIFAATKLRKLRNSELGKHNHLQTLCMTTFELSPLHHVYQILHLKCA